MELFAQALWGQVLFSNVPGGCVVWAGEEERGGGVEVGFVGVEAEFGLDVQGG